MDDAIELLMALGPAGEVIRLAGDEARSIRPKLEEAIADVLAEFQTDAGVVAPSSTWIITATA